MKKSRLEQIAYTIVKKKIDQGCKFIVKGDVLSQELASDIYIALINEQKRCALIADETATRIRQED